ncbi:MAG: YdcF family protein [Nitrosomonadales bacterium]|nr:YdcF family protein [Nitrosomonadales bacterium]
MSLSWFFTNLIGAFLLPPLNLLLLCCIGLLLWHKRPRMARMLITASLMLLWICATPYVAQSALQSLEGEPVALDIKTQKADAIVVLGGGTYFHAPEYGADTVSEASLARLRYAAKLQRETGKPVLVTGGKPLGNERSEAQQMKSVLEQEFKVPVQWTEDASDNTLENARYSYRLLHEAGIKRIYLVTHAWHMPRSVMAFRAAGFEVVPAPTAYTTHYRTDIFSFLPGAGALHDSRIFMHEMIGLLWYRLKS